MADTPKATKHPVLENAGLSERDNEIIAHGWLDIESLKHLKVDDYQREILAPISSHNHKSNLNRALNNGAVFPDIMLGMRGENFNTKGESMTMLDNVYIVDGLQRVSAMISFADTYPEKAVGMKIGAEVRFGTDKQIEKELFKILNTRRVPVSPNVILRNERDKSTAVLTLYGLSMTDSASLLFKRVQWTQRRNRGELLTAMSLARAICALHSHLGRVGSVSQAPGAVSVLQVIANNITLKVLRSNIIEFYNVVDECWGFRTVEFVATATHLRTNFLVMLARVFAEHTDFWDGETDMVLNVPRELRKKLKTFPILDPEIARLAGAGGQTIPILYAYLKDHLNKGKRSKRLTMRKSARIGATEK